MNEKIGLQLYSLRNILDGENFGEIIEEISDIGYSGVEFYEFFDKPASEIGTILDECGLEAISSHVGIDDLRENPDEVFKYHEEIDCKTIVIPYLSAEYFESHGAIRKISEELHEMSKEATERSFDLGYHNHFHEFFTLNGATAFEIFAREIFDFIGLQLDVGHIYKVGIDPVELIEKLDNRVISFHVGDILREEAEAQFEKDELTLKEVRELGSKFRDVRMGKGEMDIPSVVKLGEELGVSWFIIEDESASNPMEAASLNYNYLASL